MLEIVPRGTLKTNIMKRYETHDNLKYYFVGTILVLCAMCALLCTTSCKMYHDTEIKGKATIVTTDTTFINHNNLFKYPKK